MRLDNIVRNVVPRQKQNINFVRLVEINYKKKGPVRPFFYFNVLSDFEIISDSASEYRPFL